MGFFNRRYITIFSLLGVSLLAGSILSQSQYPENLLNQKGNFSRGAATAIGEPFSGLVTSSGRMEGLFPIRSTGVSAAA